MDTVGSLIDKLTISDLRIYHMTEQKNRDDVSIEFKDDCRRRLTILNSQRDGLLKELEELCNELASGKKKPEIYLQLKMYNEKKYKD